MDDTGILIPSGFSADADAVPVYPNSETASCLVIRNDTCYKK